VITVLGHLQSPVRRWCAQQRSITALASLADVSAKKRPHQLASVPQPPTLENPQKRRNTAVTASQRQSKQRHNQRARGLVLPQTKAP